MRIAEPRSRSQRKFSYDKHFYFQNNPNMDAAANIFFQRELEFIIPEMFERELAKINARRIFPIDRSAGSATRVITWRQFTKVGSAQIIADYADDINVVNAFGEEQSSKVRGVAVAAQWSLEEMREAAQTGRPLERLQTESARDTMMRLENGVAFTGEADFDLVGLLTTGQGIPTNAAPNGTWTQSLAADDILEDLNFAANTPIETTGDVESPTSIIMSTVKYNIIASRKHGTDTDRTILSHFLLNNPYINEIIPVRELAGAGAGGADIMIAYSRDPSKLRLQVPLDIEQLAPQVFNLVTRVPYHMRIGGLTIFKPASLHIVSGI